MMHIALIEGDPVWIFDGSHVDVPHVCSKWTALMGGDEMSVVRSEDRNAWSGCRQSDGTEP